MKRLNKLTLIDLAMLVLVLAIVFLLVMMYLLYKEEQLLEQKLKLLRQSM